jgi:hypothetical protein
MARNLSSGEERSASLKMAEEWDRLADQQEHQTGSTSIGDRHVRRSPRRPVSWPRLWEEQNGHPRVVMPMSPRFQQNKTVEEYRQLAEKCREIAGAVSAENERIELLARAQAWDLIADRIRGIG